MERLTALVEQHAASEQQADLTLSANTTRYVIGERRLIS
jgi:hypothetical protein